MTKTPNVWNVKGAGDDMTPIHQFYWPLDRAGPTPPIMVYLRYISLSAWGRMKGVPRTEASKPCLPPSRDLSCLWRPVNGTEPYYLTLRLYDLPGREICTLNHLPWKLVPDT